MVCCDVRVSEYRYDNEESLRTPRRITQPNGLFIVPSVKSAQEQRTEVVCPSSRDGLHAHYTTFTQRRSGCSEDEPGCRSSE